MEATSPTTVSAPGWCNRMTLVAGRPTNRTSVPGTAARMRGEIAAAVHCAPSMLGGYPKLPWKSTTGGPLEAGFPAGRCGRGYVLGITMTLGSADLAASSSLGTTTRSTRAATDCWNRRQSPPLSLAWYQAKRVRTEPSAPVDRSWSANSSDRSPALTSSRSIRSTTVGPKSGRPVHSYEDGLENHTTS